MESIDRALDLYRNNRTKLNEIRKNAMLEDHSWTNSAKKYLDVYNKILASKKG